MHAGTGRELGRPFPAPSPQVAGRLAQPTSEGDGGAERRPGPRRLRRPHHRSRAQGSAQASGVLARSGALVALDSSLRGSRRRSALGVRRMIFLRRPALAPIATLTLIALLAAFYILSKGRETDQARPGSITLPEIDLAVYFTDPSGPNAETLRGGPDAALALAIDSARYSVDVAVYQLNLWSVRDAILRAHRRGLRVRLVTDSDNILEAEIGAIQAAGIAILGDRRESLMHHKFVVIDQLEVWTGSMNLTVSDAYRNNNHLLRLQSSTLADDYTREFEEMFLEDRFGALSLPDTPHPQVEVAGGMVE